jgi:hypothetical protein
LGLASVLADQTWSVATHSFGERYKKTNLKVGLKYLKIDYSKVGYGVPLEDSLELWDLMTNVVKSMAFEHRQRLNISASVNSEVVRSTTRTFPGTR